VAVGGAGHFVTAAAAIILARSTVVAVVVIAGAITIATKACSHDSGR